MKQLLIALIVIGSMILTGCPNKSIQKAKDASSKLASYANAGVNITRDLYRENVISRDTKDRIADAFILLADGGIAFDLAVKKAEEAYGSSAPKAEVERLFAVFDREVVARFLAVLEKLKAVTNATAYLAVIESLKAAILIVAGAFGKKQAVEGRIG